MENKNKQFLSNSFEKAKHDKSKVYYYCSDL